MEAILLVEKIDTTQKQIDAITKVVLGGFGAKNTVSSRMRFTMFTTAGAQADITGAQREQFNLAKEAYDGQAAALNELFRVTLPALEKEFEDAGGVLYNNPPSRRRFFDEKN